MQFQLLRNRSNANRFKSGLTLAVVGALLAFCPAVSAQEIRERDTLVLKEGGKRIVGDITEIDSEGNVKIQLENGVSTSFTADKIEKIIKRQNAQQAYDSAASAISKGDANAHLKLAEWCLDLSMFDQATTQLKLTIEADPKIVRAYLLGAQLEFERIQKAETDEAKLEHRNQLLDYARRARAHDGASPVIELLKGQVLLDANLPAVAATSFQAAIKALAADPELKTQYLKAQLGLAKSFIGMGEFVKAETLLASISEANADDFRVLLLTGRCKNGLKKFTEAETALSKAISVEPVVAEAHEERGIARFEMNKVPEAVVDFQQALKLGVPDKRPVQTNLGYCYLSQGKLKSAVNSFVATRSQALYPAAELGLVAVKMRRGEYQLALDRLMALKTRIPRTGLFMALMGECEMQLVKLKEAYLHIEEALRLGFDSTAGMRFLVELSVRQGDDDRALQWIQYLTANKESAAASDLFRLGRLLLKQDREDEAQSAFETALKNQAGYIPAMNGLAYLAYKRGDYPTAKAYFEQVLRLNDSDLYAKRALKNIIESETRKVWTDTFRREGPEVTNSWETKVGFGVDIELKKNQVHFSGSQSTEAFGKTMLTRKVDDGEFVRFEATIEAAGAAEARIGIRVTSRGGEAILFRDETGKKLMGGFKKTANGKVELVELGAWPGDAGSHRLAIEIEDEKTGLLSFSIDEDRRGEAKVPALRRMRSVNCSIYGQAQLNKVWTLKLNQVRIFVRKQSNSGQDPNKKGGY